MAFERVVTAGAWQATTVYSCGKCNAMMHNHAQCCPRCGELRWGERLHRKQVFRSRTTVSWIRLVWRIWLPIWIDEETMPVADR